MTSTAPALRAQKAIEAKRADSLRKKDAVLAAIADAITDRRPITVAALARTALCSREFIYTHLADEVANAQGIQRQQGVSGGPSHRHPAAETGLRADLLLAHEQAATLRAENADLRRQLSHDVGSRLEQRRASGADLVAEKQQEIERLLSQLKQADATVKALRRQVQRLESDLAAERRAHQDTVALLNAEQPENVVPIR